MYLENELAIALELVPDLVACLEEKSLLDLERSPPQELANIFRSLGNPGLTVTSELGGGGASAVNMVQLLCWVGTRSPSLAVMMTMHHHTVAGMMETCRYFPDLKILVSSVAANRLLVASGFSEGRAHTSILDSKIQVTKTEGGYLVSGSKKPCTMTNNFDILTIGANYIDEQGRVHIGVGVISADDSNIERREFWKIPHLHAADNNEILFKNAFIPDSMLCFNTSMNEQASIDKIGSGENLFAMWFQLLASAAYLGMAKALAMRAITQKKGTEEGRAMLVIDTEGAMMALLSAAKIVDDKQFGLRNLAQVQAVRFSVQEAINRVSTRAFEMLGGMDFLSSEEASYLLVTSRVLAFHPMSKLSNSKFICDQLS